MAQVLTLKQYKDALDAAGLLTACVNEDKFDTKISYVTYDSREVTDGTLLYAKERLLSPSI